MGGSGLTTSERRGALGAAALLAAIVVVDALGGGHRLLSLPVVVPLIASLACRPRLVALLGAAAFAAALALGPVNGLLLSERHVVALVVVAAGGVVAVLGARARTDLLALRQTERLAYDRIALLDRSSRLIAAPMDFEARLRELSRLVVGDVADLAVIDLTTPDGRLDGVVASAREPEVAELVERTRASSPIDVTGEHPVAVALRTGEPQLRGAMTDDELQRYASGPEHLEVMRRLAYSSAVVVPLVARGTTLGVLSVLRLGTPQPFGDADTSLFADLAARAALAVDNARLFEERAAAEARLRAIVDNLAEAVVVSADGELVYVNDAAAALFGYGSAEEALRVPLARMYADFTLLDEDGEPFDTARLPARRLLAGEEDPGPVTLRRRHNASGEERWLVVKSSAAPDPATGEARLAVDVIEDVTEERRARQASAFLADASRVLASSLEYEDTLRAVAAAAVPQIADWCAVDLLDGEEIVHVALEHREPAKASIAAELRERYPPERDAPLGLPHVLRTGRSELHPQIARDLLEGGARDERHLELLRAIDMTSALIVPLRTGDRTIGTMSFVTTGGARRLGEADRELCEELARRAAVAIENARVHAARAEIATTLQRSLLPPRLPVVPGVALAARFRAAGEANQVGGDFYDLFAVADGWMLVIGDVTGKGPEAAAITSLARYTIRTAALYEPDPIAVVRRLNDVLLADVEHPQMCTAACVHLRPGVTVQATLVCAGHPPPYLVRAPGVLEELCRPGPLLGAFGGASWEPAVLTLGAGDGLVLYTDGVTDARGEDERFGQERLEAVLRDAAGGDADAIAEALDAALLDFQRGPQRDDMALLVLQAGAPGRAGESAVVAGSAAAPG